MDKELIEHLLDTFERAVDRKVCAQIDAGACQTNADFRRQREAEAAYYTMREQTINELLAAVQYRRK